MRRLLLFTLLIIVNFVWGQNKIPTPVFVNSLENIELLRFSDINNLSFQAKEIKKRKPGRPQEFAFPIQIDVNLSTHGNWEYLYNDMAIWRLRIKSEGAYSLNLGFTEFFLPRGAELYLYTPKYNQILGPFNANENDNHQQLWTPIIEGDEVVLELHCKIEEIGKIKLHLSYVNHDFMDVKQLKNSGDCNLDVTCGGGDGYPEVEVWRDQIQSVGAYTLNGISTCTGVLINNARNDCTPYFLTAFHCEVNEENAASVVVYWNYQNSTCRNPGTPASGALGDGSKASFNMGSKFIAGYNPSDFTLLELDDLIDPNFLPFYSGWDATSALPSSAVSIHHPGVEEKRISFDFDTLEYSLNLNQDSLYLRVVDWDIGTTEGGSSGAPLFNENRLIVGQLNGGEASCSNDLWDEFGWFHWSWEGGGTPETRLKDWLDPDKTGTTILSGKSCAFVLELSSPSLAYCNTLLDSFQLQITPNVFFTDSVMIRIADIPGELEIQLQKEKLAPGESTNAIISNLGSLIGGQYKIDFIASDSINTTFSSFIIQVTDETPSPPTLQSPVNGLVSDASTVQFEWLGESDNFHFQLSTNSDFSAIILEYNNLSESTLSSPELSPRQTYYWRVRGSNICGEGQWSKVNSFKIGNIICFTYSSDDLPAEIGEDADTEVFSSIDFPFGGAVKDLNLLNIIGRHTFISDLIFTLISPSGTELQLLEYPCSDEDNFHLNFDDDTGLANLICPINDGKTYVPRDSLSTLLGEDSKGTWTFRVNDDFSLDGGFFDQWEIQVCLDIASTAVVIAEITEFEVCQQNQILVAMTIGGGFNEDLQFSFLDSTGLLNVTFVENTDIEERIYTAVIENTVNLPPGTFSISLIVSDDINSDTVQIDIERIPGPEEPVLIDPAEDSYTIVTLPDFSWNTVISATGYQFEIASDSLFTNILEEKTLTDNQHSITSILEESQRFYWRVQSIGTCGQSEFVSRYFDVKPEARDFETSIQSLKILPNPAVNRVIFKLDTAVKEIIRIEFFSSRGQLVKEEQLDVEQVVKIIPISNLDQGLYFIRFSTDSNEGIVRKLVVQR